MFGSLLIPRRWPYAGIGVSSKLDIAEFLLEGGKCLRCCFLAVRYRLTVCLFPSLGFLSIAWRCCKPRDGWEQFLGLHP